MKGSSATSCLATVFLLTGAVRAQDAAEQVATEPAQAAALQGLQTNDRILRVCDLPYDAEHWRASLAKRRVGHDVHLTVLRDGKECVVMVQLGWRRR